MQIKLNEIKVPQQKLDETIQKNLDVIYKNSRKKKMRVFITAFTASAAVFTVGFIFCKANPVIAAQIPLIGHLFEKVEDKTMYSGDFSNNAKVLEGDNYTQKAGGLKVTLSETYSNTEAMYVSVLIESEEEFPEELKSVGSAGGGESISYLFMGVEEQFSFHPESIKDVLQLNGEFTDKHTFIGAARINFNVNGLDGVAIPSEFTWAISANEIYGFNNNEISEEKLAAKMEKLLERPEYARIVDEDGGGVFAGDENDLMLKWSNDIDGKKATIEEIVAEYNKAFETNISAEEFQAKYDSFKEHLDNQELVESEFQKELHAGERCEYEGTWNFSVDVAVDESKTILKEVNAISPDGYGVVSIEKTPYEMVINEKFSEKEDIRPVALIFDADGKYMSCKADMVVPIGNHKVSKVDIYYYNCDSQEAVDDVTAHQNEENFKQYIESIAIYHTEVKFD